MFDLQKKHPNIDNACSNMIVVSSTKKIKHVITFKGEKKSFTILKTLDKTLLTRSI